MTTIKRELHSCRIRRGRRKQERIFQRLIDDAVETNPSAAAELRAIQRQSQQRSDLEMSSSSRVA